MKASAWVSDTLPFYVGLTIRRSAEDSDDRPCIFRWSPHVDGFCPSGFILLHHAADGRLEKFEIDHSGLVKLVGEDDETIMVNGWNQFLWELVPGGKIVLQATLPERYHRLLTPGAKYELVWPGAEVAMWDWGTVRDHMNMEIRARSPGLSEESKLPRLVIPGGSHISFAAQTESVPWPERGACEKRVGFVMANLEEQKWRLQQQHRRVVSPPPMEPSERTQPLHELSKASYSPGAPFLSVTLEYPSTVSWHEILDVAVKVTYDGLARLESEHQEARPITFHKYAFEALDGPREGFRLYRRSKVDNERRWETCKLDDGTGFMTVDDPDVSVRVGQDENFVTLHPGQFWTTSRRLQGESWTSLPANVGVGDVFQYMFKGTTVDWWDWGSREEHVETVVKLPCWYPGPVVDPASNSGRPKLVVPASNVVQFTVTE